MLRIIIIAAFLLGTSALQAQVKTISSDTAVLLLKDTSIGLIDVRTPREFKEGHIPGALHMDVLESETFLKQIASLPKNKTYIVYCRSGVRSLRAVELMQQNGFQLVLNMEKGILGWKGTIIQSKNQ